MPNNTTTSLSAGTLNRKIFIQQSIEVSDGAGGVVRTWTNVFTLFAEIVPIQGQEPYFAAQLYPHINYKITIRWRDGVIPGMRVIWGTHTMRIRSMIDPQLAHVSIEMVCEELQTEGVVK